MTKRWIGTVVSMAVLPLAVGLLPAASWAQAPAGTPLPGTAPISASIDENGLAILNGQTIPTVLVNGVPTVLLPSPVIAGDVVLLDPPGPTGALDPSDILRFPDQGNGLSTWMQLLSDNGDGVDNVGDITGIPPLQSLGSNVTIPEDPSEITSYQAGANSYTVYSDAGIDPGGMTPEPGSLSLLATGGLPLLGFLRRRRQA
jgi:hypothetical protein